jgi:hypothetical protein
MEKQLGASKVQKRVNRYWRPSLSLYYAQVLLYIKIHCRYHTDVMYLVILQCLFLCK